MCGRIYIDDGTEREVRRIIGALKRGQKDQEAAEGRSLLSSPESGVKDIHPSEKAAVLAAPQGTFLLEAMRWGFPSFRSGQLLINARCESALEKPVFAESLLSRRCVIPAAGFYEWDREKNKVTFYAPEQPCIYLAGFYNLFDSQDRFIILTREANEDMAPVHDRMPLILPEEEIGDWILEPGKTKEYLQREPVHLARKQDYEQMTLF